MHVVTEFQDIATDCGGRKHSTDYEITISNFFPREKKQGAHKFRNTYTRSTKRPKEQII